MMACRHRRFVACLPTSPGKRHEASSYWAPHLRLDEHGCDDSCVVRHRTGALTPTSAQAGNYNGALSVYVRTTQPVVKPANCVATDPVFSKEALATTLTGAAAGHQIQLFVSSTQCSQYRPMILNFQINW
jgi:hypothetical protein